MMFNKVRLNKTKTRNVDRYGAYHPPALLSSKHRQKCLPKPLPRHRLTNHVSNDLSNEFKRSTILGLPRDAIPEYLDELVKEYGRSAVYSAALQQYDIYKLSPSPTRDWLEAAITYMKDQA